MTLREKGLPDLTMTGSMTHQASSLAGLMWIESIMALESLLVGLTGITYSMALGNELAGLMKTIFMTHPADESEGWTGNIFSMVQGNESEGRTGSRGCRLSSIFTTFIDQSDRLQFTLTSIINRSIMKKFLLILSTVVFFGCTNSGNKENSNTANEEKLMSVSFEIGQKNIGAGVIVAYTNDADSLWLNEEWVKSIKSKMIKLSSSYSTVLLFNGEKNMPNVATKGMDYSLEYDKYMVCGYWIYPNGTKKFCFGGSKSDGNFKKCE